MRTQDRRACADCRRSYLPTSGTQVRCLACRADRVRLVFDVPRAVAEQFMALTARGEGSSAAFARLVLERAGEDAVAAAEEEAKAKGWIREEEEATE